jgi:acyl-coenzyme A thioesterase PaaI-like protein
MLDSATAFALLMALPTNKTVVTTRLDTTFVKPALPGALMAFANIQERSERSATVVAELKTLEGEVVARASADLRIIEKAS